MAKPEIEAVFDRVRTWPEHRQQDVVNVLLEMERQGIDRYELSAEEEADLDVALQEADRGEFATDEEVAALFDKYRG